MDRVRVELRGRGYSSVTLNVVEANQRAREFYERVGFSIDCEAAPWHGAAQVRYSESL